LAHRPKTCSSVLHTKNVMTRILVQFMYRDCKIRVLTSEDKEIMCQAIKTKIRHDEYTDMSLHVAFEVFTGVIMNRTVIWDVTHCS
jgi:hypothetical protein